MLFSIGKIGPFSVQCGLFEGLNDINTYGSFGLIIILILILALRKEKASNYRAECSFLFFTLYNLFFLWESDHSE